MTSFQNIYICPQSHVFLALFECFISFFLTVFAWDTRVAGRDLPVRVYFMMGYSPAHVYVMRGSFTCVRKSRETLTHVRVISGSFTCTPITRGHLPVRQLRWVAYLCTFQERCALSRDQAAAVCLQKRWRGQVGRKRYLEKLLEKFEQVSSR